MRRSPGSRVLPGLAGAVLLVALAGCSGPAGTGEPPGGSPAAAPSEGPADGDAHAHDDETSSEALPDWRPIAGLYVPRDDFGTAVVGEEIWVLGGMTGARGTRLRSIEVLDTSTGSWRTARVQMPRGLASFESVALGTQILSFGGIKANGEPSRFATVLDTRTGRWRELPPMPRPRYAHTVTLHEGKVYVIGGESVAGAVPQVDVFDPRDESWRTLETRMPAPRGSHDTVSTPDGLMVLGGWLDGPTDRVDVLDPRSGRWSRGPTLPTTMSRSGAVVADDRLWVSLHRTSYVLDLEGPGEWAEANPLGLPRHGLGYVAVGSALYAVGGCAQNPLRDVRTTERLQLS